MWGGLERVAMFGIRKKDLGFVVTAGVLPGLPLGYVLAVP